YSQAPFQNMKKFPLFLICALLCACAARHTAPVAEDPAEVWKAMASAPSISGPERASLSMRLGEEGDTRRVTAILWGNDPEQLRMDVMAGAGAIVAMIYDGPGEFLLYTPGDNRAYIHKGAVKPLLRVGSPLPFPLARLADLLSGRYIPAFGASYESAKIVGSDAVFTLPDQATLTVDGAGRPATWTQGGGGWKMTLAYGEDDLPKSIKFDNADGKMAVLLIKERETLPTSFDPDQMTLKLPPGTETLPLSQYGKS
ncbi:MAG: hypothetical protein K2H64_02845, partial [Desulfovibrio sp.]|nr:hypothetical protein [Desulfovibrio sp.]